MSPLRRLALSATMCGSLLVPACTVPAQHSAPRCSAPSIDVTRDTDHFEPWHLEIQNLEPLSHVTLKIETVDSGGLRFSSRTSFTAPASGTLDTATLAPTSGNYQKADRSGPLTSMRRDDGRPAPLADQKNPLDYTLTLSREGCASITEHFQRGGMKFPELTSMAEPKTNGIAADYFAAGERSRPTVVIFGGGRGGYSGAMIPRLVASRMNVVSVAYSGVPGLPPRSLEVPLEYFDKVLDWVKDQPGVDSQKIILVGQSLGSQPAQDLAIQRPREIAGVVIGSGSHDFTYSPVALHRSSWTRNGSPVTFSGPATGRPLDPRGPARIPIEEYPGPMLIICGTKDSVWDSCGASRLTAQARRNLPTTLLTLEGAGHEVADMLPDIAGSAQVAADGHEVIEGFPGATALGRQKAWETLITFLEQIAKKK